MTSSEKESRGGSANPSLRRPMTCLRESWSQQAVPAIARRVAVIDRTALVAVPQVLCKANLGNQSPICERCVPPG